MKIIIDIGHPAHVHCFKYFAHKMVEKGHKILFTCRDKEFEIDLLKINKFDYVSFGKHYKTIRGKILGLFIFDFKMLKTALKFKPDLFLSAGSMYAAQASFLLRKPHIALEDTENMEQIIFYKPFTSYILTPDAIPQKYGKKQVRYNGFHQSAFLHPNYFNSTNDFKKELDIKEGQRIFLLRLVALNATHDINVEGISDKKLDDLVNFLMNEGRLFISSEDPLPSHLEMNRLNISPERIHEFMSICDLVIGESSTMSNEAGYLGVPNIFIEDIELNVLRKYTELGLKIHYKKLGDKEMDDIRSLIVNLDDIKKTFKEKSKKFVENSIDLTDFLIKFIESKIELK